MLLLAFLFIACEITSEERELQIVILQRKEEHEKFVSLAGRTACLQHSVYNSMMRFTCTKEMHASSFRLQEDYKDALQSNNDRLLESVN